LFYTDGITESRSPQGAFFGRERLADFLVRTALEDLPVAETARRLSASVIDYVGAGLSDDATLLLVEYRDQHRPHRDPAEDLVRAPTGPVRGVSLVGDEPAMPPRPGPTGSSRPTRASR
jgi:hypothetical protein